MLLVWLTVFQFLLVLAFACICLLLLDGRRRGKSSGVILRRSKDEVIAVSQLAGWPPRLVQSLLPTCKTIGAQFVPF